MVDVDGIAKSVHIHCQATHITVGNRKNLLSFNITCLYIQSSMKMPRARLSEITRQDNVIIYWWAIIDV